MSNAEKGHSLSLEDLAGDFASEETIARDSSLSDPKEELSQLKKRLEDLQSSQLALLSNLNHEIRNPIGAILGLHGILEETCTSDEQREFLGLMKESVDSLGVLIDRFQDFANLSRGTFSLKSEVFSIEDLLRELKTRFTPSAQEKEIGLAFSCPDDIENIEGDKQRLTQVVEYLVDNAIKYTEVGDVGINVTREGDHQVCFSVVDKGPGVPEHLKEEIFKPFFREDVVENRRYKGLGLGLTLASGILEKMGCELHLAPSEKDAGSVFSFTIATTTNASLEHNAKQGSFPTLREQHVLLVGSDAMQLYVTSTILRDRGYAVSTAKSEEELLEVLEKATFDIIVVDAENTRDQGSSVVKSIRSKDSIGARHTPIIALVSSVEGEKNHHSNLACSRILAKPFREKELLEALGFCS